MRPTAIDSLQLGQISDTELDGIILFCIIAAILAVGHYFLRPRKSSPSPRYKKRPVKTSRGPERSHSRAIRFVVRQGGYSLQLVNKVIELGISQSAEGKEEITFPDETSLVIWRAYTAEVERILSTRT